MRDYCRLHRRRMYPIFAAFIVLLILCLGTGTYVRNMAWESPGALWSDAARKAPSSGRALAYLAMVQSEYPGGAHFALRLYEAALAGTKTNKYLEPEIFNNMAALYYDAGDFNQAIHFWEKALEKKPDYADARFRLSLASFKAGRKDEAFGHLQSLVDRYPGHIPTRNLRGMAYFENKDYESALRDFKMVMKPGPEFEAGLLNIGAVYLATGHYEKAEAFFASVPASSEYHAMAVLWRIKSGEMRGELFPAPGRAGRRLFSIDGNELHERMEAVYRNPAIQDKVLLPSTGYVLLKAGDVRAQNFWEHQRGREKRR